MVIESSVLFPPPAAAWWGDTTHGPITYFGNASENLLYKLTFLKVRSELTQRFLR